MRLQVAFLKALGPRRLKLKRTGNPVWLGKRWGRRGIVKGGRGFPHLTHRNVKT